ncbi:CLUMA_CG013772, isoform A [Clunio marinus]|uniref:CLUMA_CG013772, isoform A n=1 Tax=Clunio marinus TaxID=568069 RepID=A0A1J1IJU5_9DIPT|nr:CLUMA_CG013772, isoform A [Clunio marinus]
MLCHCCKLSAKKLYLGYFRRQKIFKPHHKTTDFMTTERIRLRTSAGNPLTQHFKTVMPKGHDLQSNGAAEQTNMNEQKGVKIGVRNHQA